MKCEKFNFYYYSEINLEIIFDNSKKKLMFRFVEEFYDEERDIVVRDVFRFCGDKCRSVTEMDLKEMDRDICRHETVSFCALFRGCQWICSVVFPVGIDTSNVTDMGGVFCRCSSLSRLDLSTFDTSNVTDMNHMFNGCSSLSTLDLSTFNTSDVRDMWSMFNGCSSLSNVKYNINDRKIGRFLPKKNV